MKFKDFLEALQKIRKRPKTADIDKLTANIQSTYNEEAVDLLHKVLVGFGLKQDETCSLEVPLYATSVYYSGFYDHSLYQKLLPLCQLAYLSEKNGVVQEHAFKLATMFTNADDVLTYLMRFKDVNSYQYFVHDACLFDFPETKECDFYQWRILAKTHLSNPRFRELLPHAVALEQMAETGNYHKKHHLDRHAIQQKKQELSHTAKQYKDLNTKPILLLDAKQAAERPGRLKQLSEKKSARRLELATLCQGLLLNEADMLVLEAFYERYQHGQSQAHQFLIKHGLSDKDITVFNSLKRSNDDNIIPNILIDGKDIGYPESYIKKLDTLSNEGAAIAACLGKITNCCQYLGGTGNDCAAHGLSSPNGGFYVLCHGNANHPQLNDPIIAQSWAWRGTAEGLCLDSIESIKKNLDGEIIDLFRFLGHRLCQEFGIPKVNTGSKSGITALVALDNHPTQKEDFIDYQGYCDSQSQLLLANQAIPYLLYDQTYSSVFQNRIVEETKLFFKNLFNMPGLLKDNKALKQAILFGLKFPKHKLLDLLLQAVTHSNNLYHQEELKTLIRVNTIYQEQLNKNIMDLELIEQGACIYNTNRYGDNAFHLAARGGHEEIIKSLLNNKYCTSALLLQTNLSEETALILAAKYGHDKVAKVLLESEHCTSALLTHKASNDYTAFDWAISRSRTNIVKIIVASPYCSLEMLKEQKEQKGHEDFAPISPIQAIIKERIKLLKKEKQEKFNNETMKNYFFSSASNPSNNELATDLTSDQCAIRGLVG